MFLFIIVFWYLQISSYTKNYTILMLTIIYFS